jgi:uncharacterized protein
LRIAALRIVWPNAATPEPLQTRQQAEAQMQLFNRPRLVFGLIFGAVGVVVLYLAVAGFLLQRMAGRLIIVGPLAEAVAAAVPAQDPLTLGYRGDPMQALGLPFEDVTLQTALGPAPAWLVRGTPGGLTAVYVHGIAGAREDGYRHLTLLHDAGIDVLLITYRNDPGAPASPEGRYGFGLTEWPDLEGAVQYLEDQGATNIVLVGESMGGAIVGQFLQNSPLASHVVAVALDSPALDFHAVLTHIAGQFHLPLSGAVAWVAQTLLGLTGPLDLSQAQVTDVFAAFPGPLFIAHGTGDRIVPVLGTDRLLQRRSGPTVAFRTDADHLQSWAADERGYRRGFAEFLDMVNSAP